MADHRQTSRSISSIFSAPGSRRARSSAVSSLMPAAVIHGAVWQLVTYLFLHSLASLVPHPVQHADALDVRRADRRNMGNPAFSAILLHVRRGRGHLRGAGELWRSAIRTSRRSALRAPSTACCSPSGCCSRIRRFCSVSLFPIKAKYMVMIFGAIAFCVRFRAAARSAIWPIWAA